VLDEPWCYPKLRRLVYGFSVADSVASDGFRDVELASVYQQRCAALDSGRPELMLDAVQMDQALEEQGPIANFPHVQTLNLLKSP